MAAKKKVTVEIELELLKKLIETAEALTELAAAHATGCDDPAARALVKKKKTAKKRAK